jgi:hypothetical protein
MMNDTVQNPQTNNSIVELRSLLFATLRGLSDKNNPMEIDRALAINSVAQTVVNSAKVEVDGLKVLGGNGTGFIPALPPAKLSANTNGKELIEGQPGYTVHRLK